MNHVRALIGNAVVTSPAAAGVTRRKKVRFPINPTLFNEIIDLRDNVLNAADWCAGMDTLFEEQLTTIQDSVNTAARDLFQTAAWTRQDEIIRSVVKLNLRYQFKEPNLANGQDVEQNFYTSVQLEHRPQNPIGVRWNIRAQPPINSFRPLYSLFFTKYDYGGCGNNNGYLGEGSKGNYKYIIADAEIICYRGRLTAAGCAKDQAHATTKIVKGRVVKSIISPKNMCVIATIRHGLQLTNPHPGIERQQCRTDHEIIFGRDYKTTELLPLDDLVLQRLGDHYNTDLAVVGEIDKLVSKSRDRVLTLHYEHHHVWLVIADDHGHCSICKKQYTSVKWLAGHRRHCHRCPKCRRVHSDELNCDWCVVCQINHPTSFACNESRSEYYRDHNRDPNGANPVVMKFKKANLVETPNVTVLHYDIETAQFPEMDGQVPVNIEWAVRCSAAEVSFGDNVFFEDDHIMYSIGVNGMCHPLYSLGLTVVPPQREFPVNVKAWRMYSAYGRNCMQEFVSFLAASPKPYILNAYNGSRFDHVFLLRVWQAQGLMVKDVCFQNSCPIKGTLISSDGKVTHRLWDVCRHLCGSLSTNAKAAGLTVSKDSFTDFHLLVNDEALETHQTKLQQYCRQDVVVLSLLYETTAAEVYSKFGVHIVDYITTSHMTYTMAFLGSPADLAEARLGRLSEQKQTARVSANRSALLKYIEEHRDTSGKWAPITDVAVYQDQDLEEKFRAALYGGRCYPTQPLWESSQLEAVRQDAIGYEEVDDYVLDLDANSLYPYAMSQPMPVGELHEWDPATPVPPNLGIYHVKYVTNKKLMNAPLPSRGADGGLKWSLEDGQGWYTTVDIDSAKMFGYEFEFLEGYYWERQERCFQPYIDYLYTAKDKMKQLKYTPNGGYSPALYNQLKLLLNGLWGKTSQRPVARDVRQVKKEDDLIQFFEEHNNLQFMHFSENPNDINYWVQGDSNDRNGKISKPVQIADFVLAWSRRKMLEVMDTVDPGLTSCTFLYTDTDSLFVKVTASNKTRLEAMLGPNMGQLSNDLCDPKSGGKNGKVLRMVAPSPKAYSVEYILDNNVVQTCIHAKGIHSSFFTSHKEEISDALTAIVRSRYSDEEKQLATFAWGSDGYQEAEGVYTAPAPYMKRKGPMGGFKISHSHISRKLGKTQFERRLFGDAEEMSFPVGYVSE